MKILNRYTAAVIFEADAETIRELVLKAIESGANLSWADLSRANLSGANLSEANLSRANLSWADLSRANLSGANLSEANLSRANLSWADLSRADLSRANLSRADLSGAKFFALVPKVENLDAKILEAINAGGKLDMGTWHRCETTHCRAGWAIHLSENGYEWEKAIGTQTAASFIYAKSTGRVPDFYATDEEAMEDIRKSAALVH